MAENDWQRKFEDPMLDHTHLFPNTGDFSWSTFQSK
jgi:hypothetical protein